MELWNYERGQQGRSAHPKLELCDMAKWKHGNIEIWRYGRMEIWKRTAGQICSPQTGTSPTRIVRRARCSLSRRDLPNCGKMWKCKSPFPLHHHQWWSSSCIVLRLLELTSQALRSYTWGSVLREAEVQQLVRQLPMPKQQLGSHPDDVDNG